MQQPADTSSATAPRVLVLGRHAAVLETVLQELADLGIAAEGSTRPEQAASEFDPARFDLVAFGGGVPEALRAEIGRDFAARNSAIRTLGTHAPVAAREIAAALAGSVAPPAVDLDAYLARIGYDGPRTPTLETLRAITELHPDAIPFEALDVLTGRGVDLTPAAVDAKLIGDRRGGYCYEHNGLLQRALTALGFEVEALLGRVRWMAPAGSPARPRTHMALRVRIDGEEWLADVGFGGCTPPQPLRFGDAAPQPTRHETFRVFPFGAAIMVQALVDGRWSALYELSPEPQIEADFEQANWFTSTHPSSPFRRSLTLSRTTPEARHALLDNRYTARFAAGGTERRMLDAAGIEEVLADVFGLTVDPSWRPAIARAAAAQGG